MAEVPLLSAALAVETAVAAAAAVVAAIAVVAAVTAVAAVAAEAAEAAEIAQVEVHVGADAATTAVVEVFVTTCAMSMSVEIAGYPGISAPAFATAACGWVLLRSKS